MEIEYKSIKEFQADSLKNLFLSVKWSSAHYPEKLTEAMRNSGSVFSAWDGNNLVGLVNALDDGSMTVYVHYLLVHPDYQHQGIGKELIHLVREKYRDYLRVALIAYRDEVEFYENCGFQKSKNSVPMFITSLWT